jgi:hypothetical protein
MGMPLPGAVRLLAREAPQIIPWAWGLNGAASVMGSVAALAIALAAGFDQALLAAAALYGVALLLVWRMRPDTGGPTFDAAAPRASQSVLRSS